MTKIKGPPIIIPTDLNAQTVPVVRPNLSFGQISRINPSIAVSEIATPKIIIKPSKVI
ncbi:hypothetical protein ES703_113606 [subsurface metagenome]